MSNIELTIFIGYSKIEYFESTGETNKTNIIFKLDIINKEDTTNGPLFESSTEIKSFKFPNSTIVTSSSKQISCEPLRIKDDENNEFRLVCIHEGNFKATSRSWKRMVYATTIKSDLSNFEDSK